MVCNSSRAVWKYIWHLDTFDIIDNSDSIDSRQEQTCLQNLATVCISNRAALTISSDNLVIIVSWKRQKLDIIIKILR